jgi:uncharacterized protein YoaH (UPF0181 family)
MTKSRIMSTAEAISRIADELKRRNDAALIEEITLMLGIQDALREEMVAQALRAEQEISDGKGLTPKEARTYMQAAFKG